MELYRKRFMAFTYDVVDEVILLFCFGCVSRLTEQTMRYIVLGMKRNHSFVQMCRKGIEWICLIFFM